MIFVIYLIFYVLHLQEFIFTQNPTNFWRKHMFWLPGVRAAHEGVEKMVKVGQGVLDRYRASHSKVTFYI
jgi:hypothetical protein